MTFWTLLTSLLSSPQLTWRKIADLSVKDSLLGINSDTEEQYNRDYISKFYLPALILSMSGSIFGQTTFGIYLGEEHYKPLFFPLLAQTILQGIFILLMPFILSKPFKFISNILGGKSDLESARRLIIFSYFVPLTLSALQFIPLFNIFTLLIGIYSMYIFYVGIGNLLGLKGSKQLICFIFGFSIFLSYFLCVGLILLYNGPQPYPDLLRLIISKNDLI